MALGRGGIRVPIISEFDERGIKKFANQTQALGRSLTMKLTLPIIGLGAAAVKMSMEFETSMAKITGLVGIAADQTKIMGDQAIEMASKYGKSANEAANALFFITSAGFRGKEAMDVLESSLKASAIGLGDTAVVADALTSAVNAYGSNVLSASKATDILVATVREGKLEASALAGSLGSVLGIAAEVGVPLEQVGAFLAVVSKNGIDAAQGVVQLRGILSAIQKPTSQANKELEKYGLSAAGLRNQIREKGLLSTLVTLRDKIGENDESISKIFGNVRALNGVLALTGAGLEDAIGIFERLNDASGDTDAAFAVIAETAGFKMNVAFQTAKNSLISFGDILAPIVIRGAEFVKALADRFKNLTDEQRKVILVTLGVAAAIGPVLILISLVTKAVLVLASVFALLSKTIVLVPLIIFSLIAAFKAQSDAQYILAKETGDTFGMIRRFIIVGLTGVSQEIENFINTAIRGFARFRAEASFTFNPKNMFKFDPNGKKFEAYLSELNSNLNLVDFSKFRKRVEDFDDVLIGVGKTVSEINAELGDSTAIADEAQKKIDDLIAEMENLGEVNEKTGNKTSKLKDRIKELRNEMVKIKTQAVEALKESLNEAQKKLDDARDKFNNFKNSITGAITGIINFGKAAESDNFLQGLTQQADAATSFADKVKKLVQMGLSERAISEVLKSGFEAGSKIADEIIAGGSTIVNQVNTLLASVDTVADQVGDFGARQFYQAGITQGEALVNGILDALRQAQAELAAAVKAAAQGGDIRTFGARATNLLDAIGGIKGSKKSANAMAAFEAALAGSGKISKKEDAAIRARFKLAKGGIVMGPTNALIGEAGPEAVIPLSGANSARGAMGSTINITVNAGIGTDGTLVGRQIVESIKRYERSSGPVFARA
jgi:TP901 family phage tail tape measure protein